MSAIDEGIVREYFEQNGFFVRQVRKYQVQARRKTGDEEIDLLVYNPGWRPGGRRPDFVLLSHELARIRGAVVAVKPWHTDVFTPALLRGSREIFAFLDPAVLAQAGRLFPEADAGAEELAKILIVPALPAAEPLRSESIALLRERGIDGVLTFRVLLQDLIARVDTNRSYGKSDTLQMIRVLKNYGLLKDAQLDLLTAREGPARRVRRAATTPNQQ